MVDVCAPFGYGWGFLMRTFTASFYHYLLVLCGAGHSLNC